MHVYTYVCMHACMHVCMYVCIYAYTYVYTYIYICIKKSHGDLICTTLEAIQYSNSVKQFPQVISSIAVK